MESRSNFYEEVLIGALLHDIGKFIQKSYVLFNGKGQHPQVSKDFLEPYKSQLSKRFDSDAISEIVQKHHSNSKYFRNELNVKNASKNILPFAHIVCQADNFSSKERDIDHKESDFKTRAMDIPFSNISLFKNNTTSMQYVPNTYEAENLFAKKQPAFDRNLINKHVANFKNEFTEAINSIEASTPFENIYNSIYNILKRYLWCIPSCSYDEIADISLFDHSKTTSAIAACMYQYHQAIDDFSVDSIKKITQPKFLIFATELLGLEDYAISITENLTTQSVSKRLKARTFKLTAILDIISIQIIENFKLPISNIIIDNGRKIYILLPNTDKAIEYIKNLDITIQNILYTQYHSKIRFNYDYIKMSGEDFSNFGDIFEKLNRSLEYKKLKPFYSILSVDKNWNEEKFIFDIPSGSSICKGCGSEFSKSDSDLGKECINEINIGTKLSNIKAYEIVKAEKADIQFGDKLGINIITDIKNISDNKFTYVLDFDNFYYNKNICFKTISHYLPKDGNDIMTFDKMSENIKHIKRFGYLKMDIDNMSLLFSEGLKTDKTINESYYNSISRIATVSRTINMFFTGYIDKLIKDNYDLCYIVYSNDDDLIILGLWSLIIDLSINLNNDFKNFVGYNSDINLSAAIEFSHINTPISHVVNTLNEDLHKSKVLGNHITIFSQTITFDELEYLRDEANKLKEMVEKNKLTHGELWKIKKYGRMIKENNIRYKMLIAYDIGRKKSNKDKTYIDWIEPVLNGTDKRKSKLLEAIADLTFMNIRE